MNIADFPNAQAVHIHNDLDDLSLAVAQRISELAAQAIATRGVFHIVMAGGETPQNCYEKLRQLPVEWKRVQVYFGDERCFPIGDARRNDTMIQNILLRHVGIPEGNIHAIPAELGAREAATRYADEVTRIPRFDLVLLGMGEDGHIASLFPGDPVVEDAAACVPVFNAPKPPVERVSLGIDQINSARQKIFLVAGAGKRNIVEKLLAGVLLPAARIVAAEWHIDRAALPITYSLSGAKQASL